MRELPTQTQDPTLAESPDFEQKDRPIQELLLEGARGFLRRAAREGIREQQELTPGSREEYKWIDYYSRLLPFLQAYDQLDEKLFQSEYARKEVSLEPLIEKLPDELRIPAAQFLVDYAEEVDEIQNILSRHTAAELFQNFFGVIPAEEVKISVKSASFLIEPTSQEDYLAACQILENPFEEGEHPAGFQGIIQLEDGHYSYQVIQPLAGYLEYLPSKREAAKRLNSTMRHERQHALYGFLHVQDFAVWQAETPQNFFALLPEYFKVRLHNELTTALVSGDKISDYSGEYHHIDQGDLKSLKEGVSFINQGAYDYPHFEQEGLWKHFHKQFPEITLSEFEENYRQAQEEYYRMIENLIPPLSEFAANDYVEAGKNQRSPLYRLFELMPVDSWASHLERLNELGEEEVVNSDTAYLYFDAQRKSQLKKELAVTFPQMVPCLQESAWDNTSLAPAVTRWLETYHPNHPDRSLWEEAAEAHDEEMDESTPQTHTLAGQFENVHDEDHEELTDNTAKKTMTIIGIFSKLRSACQREVPRVVKKDMEFLLKMKKEIENPT